MATIAKTVNTKVKAEPKPIRTLGDITGIIAHPYNDRDAIPLDVSNPSLLYGVELEIENMRYYADIRIPDGVLWKEDHSLRNNGMELVTDPMTASVLHCVLEKFFTAAKLSQERNYSERCSVHVHANCLNMTLEQIASVCLLYQVFEGVLFNWIGNDRNKNIFCVPWSETQLHYGLINNIKDQNVYKGAIKQWHKYTALNLLPLTRYGTLEFRHMAGTCDLNQIFTWVNLIGRLFYVATTRTLEDIKKYIIDLNSTSAYRQTLDNIFDKWGEVLKRDNYEAALEEGVLSMKYSLMAAKEKKPTLSSFFEQAEVAARQQRNLEEENRIARARLAARIQETPPERPIRGTDWPPANPAQELIRPVTLPAGFFTTTTNETANTLTLNETRNPQQLQGNTVDRWILDEYLDDEFNRRN